MSAGGMRLRAVEYIPTVNIIQGFERKSIPPKMQKNDGKWGISALLLFGVRYCATPKN